MAIITKITTQQKNKDRYNVFLDYGKGEEFAFSVDSDVLLKFQLKKGMELDELALMEINYNDDIHKAYNLAIHSLAIRMRSEKEVSDYLRLKDVEEPVIHEVIHKLIAQKYLNDREFALAYVRTQMNTTDKGANVISKELKDKGIKEGILTLALLEYPLEAQVETAAKLAQKFFQKNSKDSQRVLQQKLESLLLRKGFSFDVIHIATNELELSKDEEEEMEAVRYQGEKILRKYNKYSGFELEQKVKQALYQKGFSFDLIDKFLAENENLY